MISAAVRAIQRRMTRERTLLTLVFVVIVVGQLLQAAGQTTFDTKLDLVVDPGRFLARSLSLWSSESGLGELQNQAYGYLFPMGPVFWVCRSLGISPWVTERLWSGALTLTAFEGTRRLALAWGGLGRGGAIIAGAAFIAAPRFVTTIGVLTGETLPTAVLPWVVLPLVLARRGRLAYYPAVLISAVATLFMGGHNAVETLATFPMPAIVLLSGVFAHELKLRVFFTWVMCVMAACFWWLGPLVLLGRYSPPFLDYIESAANTTANIGWFNAVRGTDHWLAFIQVGGRPWWVAGHALATNSWLVLVTALVAACGLAGLLRRNLPDRNTLLIPLTIGLTCLVAAHGTASGGLFAEPIRDLLDGPLAPFRNVHKVDPLVRLPLALGFALFVGDVLRAWSRSRLREAPSTRVVMATSAAVLLALSAQPALAGNLRFEPGWSELPSAWTDASVAMDALPDGSRVLIVPGSGFGLQVWGRTVDEPLQPLASTPWVVRGQAPLVPAGTVRLLDSFERLFASGKRAPALAPALRRAGITHVLLRTDLEAESTDAPDPHVVRDTLASSPGLDLSASFGVPSEASMPLELWDVAGIGAAAGPPVRLTAASETRTLLGGPESLLPLLESELISWDAPTILTGDSQTGGEIDLLTDGLQRREHAFGRVHSADSSLMTADDPFRIDRPVHDFLDSHEVDGQAVAWYPGLLALSATSSAGYADVFGAVQPESGPYSALDGQLGTRWVSAPFTDPVGQGLSLVLAEPRDIRTVTVTVAGGLGQAEVTRVRVTTDQGSTTERVNPFSGDVEVALPAGNSSTLRVTVASVARSSGGQQVGITEIRVPGLDTSRSVILPGQASAGTTLSFSSAEESRACSTVRSECIAARARPSEESFGLDRVFALSETGSWGVRAQVIARRTPATAALLAPLASDFTIVGSSFLANDPQAAPIFALDGDPTTSWIADSADQDPTLTLQWPRPRTFERVTVASPHLGTRVPSTVHISAGSSERTVSLDADGSARFEPLRSDHVTLTFSDATEEDGRAEPMGISELVIDGLEDLTYFPSPVTATGEPCGFGPTVVVDGKKYDTRVEGSLGDVLDAAPVNLSVCTPGPLNLSTGLHRFRILSTDRFQPIAAQLIPASAQSSERSPTRSMVVAKWTNTDRRLNVGEGAESVLWVSENDNPGWVANLDGRELMPVRLDGWSQGWKVPAGRGGTVELTYAPQRMYVTVLAIGGLLASTLLLLSCVCWRRKWGHARAQIPSGMRQNSLPVVLLGWEALGFVSLFGGAGAFLGAVAVLLPGGRRLVVRQAVVIAAMAIAGLSYVHGDGRSVVADILAAIAVGVVISPLRAEKPGG